MKDSTKKYLKRVFIGYLFVLAAFIINRYLEYRNRYFYNLTEKTLKTGAEMIYDDKLNIIGKIEYKNSDTGLNLSINGKEITGKKTNSNEIYRFNPILYESINMEFKEFKKENCYYYNDNNTIIVLCLLQSWFIKYSPLEQLSYSRKSNGKSKKRQVFMIAKIEKKDFDWFLNYYPNSSIQEYVCTEAGIGQLYKCYFVQSD